MQPHPAVRRRFAHFLLVCVALSLAAAAGCTPVRLIADYDAQTDRAVTELQREVEGFLTRLERTAGTPEGEYAGNEEFYDQARVDLSAIRVRAASRARNELQLQQLDLLQQSLNNLEALHRLGISREQIPPLRTAFNSSFTSILRLELAKRRGA
jgi:hypothetical protein